MFKSLRRIIAWTGEPRRIYLGFLCSFFITIAAAAPIMIAAWCAVRIVEGSVDIALAAIGAALIVTSVVVRGLLMYVRARLTETLAAEAANRARLRMGEALKRVPMGWFDEHSAGEVLAQATTELAVVEVQGMKMVDILGNGYIVMATFLIFMFALDWRAGLVGLAAIAVATLLLERIYADSKRVSPAQNDEREAMSAATLEYIHGMQQVKSYGQTGAAISSVRGAYRRMKEAALRTESGFAPVNAALLFALRLACLGVVGVALAGFLAGTLELLPFVMMGFFGFHMFQSLEAASDAAYIVGHLAEVIDRIEAVCDARAIDSDATGACPQDTSIEMRDVSFGYEAAQPVLEGLSLYVAPGEHVALVGASGSGKTTITKLMMRFYDVQGGSVRVGGRDVREMTCDKLMENFAMVFQDVYLMNDTVERNIALGRAQATHDQVVAAAKAARCHDFIEALPQGYATVVGEGGAHLSGGERQRISIARAILKDAPIVVLDEATSSVDMENEAEIIRALTALTKEKTTVSIAHRLNTVSNADCIFVIGDGRVVQQGTHAQLMQQAGPYTDFVRARQTALAWNLG